MVDFELAVFFAAFRVDDELFGVAYADPVFCLAGTRVTVTPLLLPFGCVYDALPALRFALPLLVPPLFDDAADERLLVLLDTVEAADFARPPR